LDWECFKTFPEAEARAKELVRRDETYIIEERGQDCPRCAVALSLKTAHDAPVEPVTTPKYCWQQAVLDAFTETHPEALPLKVNAAEHAISVRLCDNTPADSNERMAIREALQRLRALLSEGPRKGESGAKKSIA
jgi:hypothetical protein